MKKILVALLEIAFCSTLVLAKKHTQPANFAGNWVLDFDQTENLPAGLEAYSMVVNQDQQQIKVETSLEGNLQPAPIAPNAGRYPGGTSAGYPGRRSGAGRMGGSTAGGGMGRSGGGRASGGRPAQGSVAAYTLYPSSAVYKLDGSESTAQLADPEHTDATIKAVQARDGEVLRLSLKGRQNPGEKDGKTLVKDQWRISKDGKSLEVTRKIKSPEDSGTMHLVFIRKEIGSTSSAAPGTKN
jgi:hypothetical protein